MKIGTKYLLVLAITGIIACGVGIAAVNYVMRQVALQDAHKEAMALLDRNLAIHTYFSHQLKPKVFEALKGAVPDGYFEPAWMSSTYAVRGIDRYFQDIAHTGGYYYKECALNARDPRNEADGYEREFIRRLNADPKLNNSDTVRYIDDKPFFVVLRRGEVMEQVCLRCHSTPEKAPLGMVEKYGPQRSFGRRVGEVVSAISMRVPLAGAYAQTKRITYYLAGGLVGLLLGLLLVLAVFNRRLFAGPLEQIRESTSQISPDHLTEKGVPDDLPGEWSILAGEFNQLLDRLRYQQQHLEEEVAKRTEELAFSEETFRLFFKSSPDSIAINRIYDGLYVDINDGFTRNTGFSREDAIGRTSKDINIWHDPRDRAKLVAAVEENGYYENLEAKFCRKDGSLQTGLMSARKIDINSEPHLITITRDISDIKKAQDELARERQQLFNIFDSINALIDVVDLNTYEVLFINRFGKDLLGYDPTDRKCYKVFHEYQQPCGHCNNERLKTDPNRHEQWEYYSEIFGRHMLANNQTILWPDGRLAKLELSFDISDRKKMEQERDTLEVQLRQAQKMEAVGTLAGGIAHDFNNILAAIMGYTEIALEEQKEGKTTQNELQGILQSANRAKNLVQQILTFSRRADVQFKLVDVNNQLLVAANLLKQTLPKMVDIRLELSEDVTPVMGDPYQIEQILMNLGTNSRDAMPDGGTLTIATSQQTVSGLMCRACAQPFAGDYVTITVTDTGEGMKKEELERIFEPFFTTKEVGKGTGLGLATIFGIVKSHGGHITCTSELGKGTAFTIYLPPAEGEVEDVANTKPEEDIEGGQETVLLVDDEAHILDIGSQNLSRAGYEVITAPNGEEALEVFNAKGDEIDLVILDLSMPGMGGHKCLQELLSLAPGLKVIVSTGYSRDGDLSETMSSGAAALLSKPFSKHEMLKTVRMVLDA